MPEDYLSEQNDSDKDPFFQKVPGLFIEQFKFISDKASRHIYELKQLKELLASVTNCMPVAYRTKQSEIVNNNPEIFALCPVRWLDGIIENIGFYLDSEFGEVIYTIMGGAYRSSLITLRHMLQLSCWTLQAVLDKSGLTEEKADSGKSMSIEEFEIFLEDNMGNIAEKKSSKTPKREKKNIRTVEGLAINKRVSDKIVSLTYGELSGKEGLKQLYGDLSKFAHANVFKKVDLQEDQEQFFPSHSKDEFEVTPPYGRFHKALNYIFQTVDLILSMLIISAFEELSFHSIYRAHSFLLHFSNEVNSVDSPQLRQLHLTLNNLFSRAPISDVKKDELRIAKYDRGEVLCSNCETVLFDDQGCPYCLEDISDWNDDIIHQKRLDEF